MKAHVNIMWFRRDLRLEDNAALYHALKSQLPVIPVFIFDRAILDKLDDKTDRRVEFIHSAVVEMQQYLQGLNSSMEVYYGFPKEVFETITSRYEVEAVFTNRDYEPYGLERDQEIKTQLSEKGIAFKTYKDQVIFECNEVMKDNGTPYTVFTPYSKRWKAKLNDFYLSAYPVKKYQQYYYQTSPNPIPTLESMGFKAVSKSFPAKQLRDDIISKYHDTRDFPGNDTGTSRLGVHFRFGTVSIRKVARVARSINDTYLGELIWRDFYQMILCHFPQLGKGAAFKPQYEHIQWRNNEEEFKKWCDGQTGYPIVDAGMRELNATGFMHNRVRMVVASFLTKHLLIDWRWGEAYFAAKLLDYDLASNNGGWQWAAGCGCDAAPYFRVFNPSLQTQKFDKALEYVRKWVPEFEEFTYPRPIVQHEFARKRALEVYAKALNP
ncbi:deoxyribodipyrimidine photo-lyase [Segetibacter sp. 3557_3]|uniref:cryptochrome/photolyase family protein n=1 Tax=Segetibacter sp. 3557_3 TaxID=2547429 RepID=UPI001058CBF9|nr:deoxyribodipyrimidine photo-lyase [Segetibacter sp. 3557_3]TDH18279.1 deoxyribodipyrimidine photo-lyase [Segetibacter sp. 3557_3]